MQIRDRANPQRRRRRVGPLGRAGASAPVPPYCARQFRKVGYAEARREPGIGGEEIIAFQELVRRVPVPDHVYELVLDLARCLPSRHSVRRRSLISP